MKDDVTIYKVKISPRRKRFVKELVSMLCILACLGIGMLAVALGAYVFCGNWRGCFE